MLIGVGVFLLLLIVGRSGILLPLLGGLLAILIRLAPVLLQILMDHAPGWYRRRSYQKGQSGDGSRSSVKTRYLSMELDHATGTISGLVHTGRFRGRHLHELDRTQLQQLYRDYVATDEESAHLLRAYLEKVYGETDWDDSDADAAAGRGAAKTGMTKTEALEVLGLEAGCSRQMIVDAHRRLIQKLHPDRGGSDYLAAKINQAKDVLLKQTG